MIPACCHARADNTAHPLLTILTEWRSVITDEVDHRYRIVYISMRIITARYSNTGDGYESMSLADTVPRGIR